MSGSYISRFIKENRFPLIACSIHWLSTFFTEQLVFEVARSSEPFNYVMCKGILFFALFGFWRLIWRGLLSPSHRENDEWSYLRYALPYFVILILWMAFIHPYQLVSDELNLYNAALQLNSYVYWFNYFSGFYWIITLMAVPHYLGPVVIKMFLQSLVAGYCITRQRKHGGKWGSLLIYVMFLLPFVMDQAVSAHRLPTYGVLYLFLVAKLIYDRLENHPLDWPTLVLLSFVMGVLAFWRTEGIYMIPLGVILLASAYRQKLNKEFGKRVLVYVLIILFTLFPQYKGYSESDAGVGVRSKPLCGYILCNMFRNGLTEEDIAPEREDIETYLKLSTIREYNDKYGDSNYSRAIVMAGVEQASYEEQEAFCNAVFRVMLKHPGIYLRSQWNTWKYISRQYAVSFKGDLRSCLHACVNLSYRQWVPCALVLAAFFYALLTRKWLVFWITGGGIANWVLVFLLQPAAYAKYYYVDYLMGCFLLTIGICTLIGRKDS